MTSKHTFIHLGLNTADPVRAKSDRVVRYCPEISSPTEIRAEGERHNSILIAADLDSVDTSSWKTASFWDVSSWYGMENEQTSQGHDGSTGFLECGLEQDMLVRQSSTATASSQEDSPKSLGSDAVGQSNIIDTSSWKTAWTWNNASFWEATDLPSLETQEALRGLPQACPMPVVLVPLPASPQTGAADADARCSAQKQPVAQASESGPTTVMFRNIPNNYTRDMILELLDSQGFVACYDFFYWPMDFNKNAGLGYAFVNLVSPDEAVRFKAHFHGFTQWQLASQKVGEVVWSEPLQGLAPHVERYRNSPIMHEGVPDLHKPLLFSNGQRIPFPAPTRRIRVPRGRRLSN